MSAAAQVAAHGCIDIRVGGMGRARQQGGGRHDLPGLAVSALRYIERLPGHLHRVQAIRREPFNGGDWLTANDAHMSHAGTHRLAAHQHGACAANPHSTPVLGALEIQNVA